MQKSLPKIAVLGSSGHARVVLDAVARQGLYSIAGLVDSAHPVGERVAGHAILGGDDDLCRLVDERLVDSVIVSIGDNFARARVAEKVRQLCPKIAFATVIHPNACIAGDVTIGDGSVIMAGAVIQSGCRIGDNCLLNTKASLDHDSVMADFSSLAPGVTAGAGCHIESFAAIGIGAVLASGVRIGEHAVVGAGAVVIGSIESFSVSYGVPSRTIRNRQPGDPYL